MLGLIGQRFVKGAAFGDANLLERLFQHIFLKLPHTGKIHIGHIGALLDDHNQHIAAGVDPHVIEQAQRKQGPYRAGRLVIAVAVANPERQRRKNGSGLNPLQSIHPDVFDHERLQRKNQRRDQPQGAGQEHAAATVVGHGNGHGQ